MNCKILYSNLTLSEKALTGTVWNNSSFCFSPKSVMRRSTSLTGLMLFCTVTRPFTYTNRNNCTMFPFLCKDLINCLIFAFFMTLSSFTLTQVVVLPFELAYQDWVIHFTAYKSNGLHVSVHSIPYVYTVIPRSVWILDFDWLEVLRSNRVIHR